MRCQPLNSLREIGIDFRSGHNIAPLPNIKQVLWFRLASNVAITSHILSQTYFWIEKASGHLVALVLNNLEYQPEEVIPLLYELTPDGSDGEVLSDQFCESWLLPPEFCALHVRAATIIPQRDFLWEIIKQQVATMLGIPVVSGSMLKRLELVLDISTSELSERFGVPLPELPEEVADFQSMAQSFQMRLFVGIVDFFDEYAALLNARTLTIENYNTARAWSVSQCRNRMQAIRVFPWLFHELGLRSGGSDHYHEASPEANNLGAAIPLAIDLGQPLIPLLAKQYNVRKHTLRYARVFLKYRYRIPETIPLVLWLLDGIKPDRRPASDADMQVLHSAIDFISGWQSESDRVYVQAVAAALFSDGIPGFRKTLRHWCPSHNPDNPFPDVADYLAYYAEQAGHGSISTELLDSLTKEWIRETGLISLLAESEHWHTAWWVPEVDIEVASWTPLVPESSRIGNLVAHELSNTQLLIEEGRAMHHCIASYFSLCSSGDAFIFSLRNNGDGKRRSTLHIGLSDAGIFTIREHRAFANREPDQDCIDAAFQLADALSAFYPSYQERRQRACRETTPSVTIVLTEIETV